MRNPRVFHLIHRAHCAVFRAADQALRECVGLTASQHAVLLVLSQRNGAPITAIAEELNMGKSSLTGLIDRMTAKGLVRREPSAADARSVEIFIEDLGRATVERTKAGIKCMNTALLEPFSSQERAVIQRFLEHVSSNAAAIVSRRAVVKFKSASDETRKEL